MKYVVFLADGAADEPFAPLGNKTPLQLAHKPMMDKMAQTGSAGLLRNFPDHLPAGSDTANLSCMGYNPDLYYSGRSPIEAVSMGVKLEADDVACRCNFVTLSNETDFASKTMVDYSAGEITTEEAHELIAFLNEHFANQDRQLYPGVSYRHCLLLKHGSIDMDLTPPHDFSDKVIGDYMPKGAAGAPILELIKEANQILPAHPVNQKRLKNGLNPANAIWIWGQGTKLSIPNFYDLHQLKAAVISATDLIQGIGISAGMEVIHVPGVTGNLLTNFKGKGEAAIQAFKDGIDYVYVHIEAPDECGHQGDAPGKVKSIEIIDKEIIAPVWKYLEDQKAATGEDYRMIVLPDHPTPLAIRAHTRTPVPFALYSSDGCFKDSVPSFTEDDCATSGIVELEGYKMFSYILNGKIQN